eukprot:TRINITY_DN2435_c0_g1_i1.p1 TRINITY_DN2435_c0_g1~~TRINITY_DN2435_c0_g1_i1.p1  ORF type:complete len:410 (-),score=99.70 TRINITY_DN2435_c0_g1_i1:29-1258(-)
MSVFEAFGSDIPYAEPSWYRGFSTPYYNDSHVNFRAKVRDWCEKEIVPNVEEWEENQDYPRDLHRKCYEAGIYGAIWPKQYGGTPPENFDIFHELIYWDELARATPGGALAACFLTIKIALPPILYMGPRWMKEQVAPEIISGKKIIALCITEPQVGSDVSGLTTTAVRDGDDYIINGQKKFITSGMKADYFTVAVRTGKEGMGGISLFLVDAHAPGIRVRKLKTQGWLSSNTAHVLFDEVRVPAKNLIGQENMGFLAIMLNFNHERFTGIVMTNRGSRNCIEDAIAYARVRSTFGQRLIDHQVIRHKIAEMATRVEGIQAQIEQLAFQMKQGVDPRLLGGPLALLKVQATKAAEFCAREASQIFGGNSYLRSGPGARVERTYREVRVGAIGGGSEEVMLDLAMKQARL